MGKKIQIETDIESQTGAFDKNFSKHSTISKKNGVNSNNLDASAENLKKVQLNISNEEQDTWDEYNENKDGHSNGYGYSGDLDCN